MANLRTTLCGICFFGFLGLIVFGVLQPKPWGATSLGACFFGAALTGFFSVLDSLDSFKGGITGFEARTRKVVQEAKEAVSELQQMAESMAAVLFELIDGGGRFGGAASAAEKDARKLELHALLVRLKIPPDRIAAATAPERRWAIIDYVSAAVSGMPDDAGQNQAWNEFWRPWENTLDRPGVKELEVAMKSFGATAKWRLELLKDYRHYVRTGKHRRPGLWARRDEWREWSRDQDWPM